MLCLTEFYYRQSLCDLWVCTICVFETICSRHIIFKKYTKNKNGVETSFRERSFSVLDFETNVFPPDWETFGGDINEIYREKRVSKFFYYYYIGGYFYITRNFYSYLKIVCTRITENVLVCFFALILFRSNILHYYKIIFGLVVFAKRNNNTAPQAQYIVVLPLHL